MCVQATWMQTWLWTMDECAVGGLMRVFFPSSFHDANRPNLVTCMKTPAATAPSVRHALLCLLPAACESFRRSEARVDNIRPVHDGAPPWRLRLVPFSRSLARAVSRPSIQLAGNDNIVASAWLPSV